MVFNLSTSGAASRYQSDFIATKGVDNNQDNSRTTFSDCHKAIFSLCIGIQSMNSQGVVKHPFCIGEGNTVLSQVTCSFGRVELEVHEFNICILCIYVKLMILATNLQ
jgi:hypothetical protein